MFRQIKKAVATVLILSLPGIVLTLVNWGSTPVQAQQSVSKVPNCSIPFNFTAAGSTGGNGSAQYFDNRGRGCVRWVLRYASSGFSAISIQFDQAPDANQTPGSFSTFAGTTSAALPVTTTTFTQVYGYGYMPWVRVTLNSKTGTGHVMGVLEGYSDGGDLSPVNVVNWGSGTLVSGVVATAMTLTTSTQLIPGAASNYLYITSCQTSNASTTVSTDILLQDGSGGTTLAVLAAPAASVATTGGGGGSFPMPTPLKVPTIGNGLFAANVTTGSSTKINCQGYKAPTSY